MFKKKTEKEQDEALAQEEEKGEEGSAQEIIPVEDSPIVEDETEVEEPQKGADEEVNITTEAPLPSAQPLEEEKPKKSFIKFLFDPETKRGRFMRTFMRWAAAIVGFFALGFLTAYLVLYQPTKEIADESTAEAAQLAQDVEETQSRLETNQADYADLEANSWETINGLKEDLALSNTKIEFLVFKNDINLARRALVFDDEGAAAMEALTDAEENLNILLPDVEAIDPIMAELLSSRLSVVKSELVRDADQAKLELESLYNTLLEFEMELFE